MAQGFELEPDQVEHHLHMIDRVHERVGHIDFGKMDSDDAFHFMYGQEGIQANAVALVQHMGSTANIGEVHYHAKLAPWRQLDAKIDDKGMLVVDTTYHAKGWHLWRSEELHMQLASPQNVTEPMNKARFKGDEANFFAGDRRSRAISNYVAYAAIGAKRVATAVRLDRQRTANHNEEFDVHGYQAMNWPGEPWRQY